MRRIQSGQPTGVKPDVQTLFPRRIGIAGRRGDAQDRRPAPPDDRFAQTARRLAAGACAGGQFAGSGAGAGTARRDADDGNGGHCHPSCRPVPRSGLAPDAGFGLRPVFLRWMLFMATQLYPDVLRYYYSVRYSTDPAHAPAIRAQARRHIDREFDVLAEVLGDKPFLLGEKVLACDLYACMLISWAPDREELLRPFRQSRTLLCPHRRAAVAGRGLGRKRNVMRAPQRPADTATSARSFSIRAVRFLVLRGSVRWPVSSKAWRDMVIATSGPCSRRG